MAQKKFSMYVLPLSFGVVALLSLSLFIERLDRSVSKKMDQAKKVMQIVVGLTLEHAVRDINEMSSKFSEQRAVELLEKENFYSQLRVLSADGKELFRVNKYESRAGKASHKVLQNKSHRYYMQDLLRLKDQQIYISPLDYNFEYGIAYKTEITFRIGKRLSTDRFIILNINSDYIKSKLDSFLKLSIAVEERPEIKGLSALIRGDATSKINYTAEDLVTEQNPNIVLRPWTLWITAKFDKERRNLIWILGVVATLFIFLGGAYYFIVLRNREHLRVINLFKQMIDDSAIFSMTDLSGKIIYSNKMFQDISGYSEEEILGNTHRMIKSGLHSEEFFKQMWKTITSGQIWTGKIRNKRKDGSHYWVYSIITPVLNYKDKIEGYAALRFDITRAVELEAKITTFQTSNIQSVGKMSANLAHQFGTPLAIIASSTEILMDSLSDVLEERPKMKKQFVQLKETIQEINDLTTTIKHFGRHSSEDLSSVNKANLKEVLEHTIKTVHMESKGYRIEIDVDFEALDIIISGHHILLTQVFLNLFNNSIFALKESQEAKWIRVKVVENVEDSVTIHYSDSGHGIPESVASKMFDAYFSTKTMNEGTGLGLSFCWDVLDFYKGSLEYVNSKENTTFALHFKKENSNG